MTHETLLELFRQCPEMVAWLLAEPFGVRVPRYRRVETASAELTDLTPTEYRADVVVVFADAAGTPVLAVIVEAQLGRDNGKRRSWPVYVTTLHARLRCPTMLLVVCAEASTASWCGRSIEVGHPGFVLRPLVLGPERVPVVTDPVRAEAAPELAVLSALAHGLRPEREKIFEALLAALSSIDDERARMYYDFLCAELPDVARQALEALMSIETYQYRSDFARKYFSEGREEGRIEGNEEGLVKGRVQGEASAVLTVLAARGFDVPDAARARIEECTDLDRLQGWLHRAVTADTIDDVLD